MRDETAFEVLALPLTATADEVKTRWRELASLYHPDNGGDAAKFHQAKTAYEIAHRVASEPKPCDSCGGSGKIKTVRGINVVTTMCQICGGAGI